MSAEGSKYHWASSSTYWLSGRGESFGTRQLEKTTRPSGWIGSAKLPFPHYRPHSADLSQVWADVVEVVGDAYYLATEGSWVVPLSRSKRKDDFVSLLEDQTNVFLISEFLRRATCAAHWQTMRDRKPESSAVSSLAACLTNSLHERILSWLFFICLVWNTTRTLLSSVVYSGMKYKFMWHGSSEDSSGAGKKYFDCGASYLLTQKHQMLLHHRNFSWVYESDDLFVCFLEGGYRNHFTTPGRPMHIKCHLWGHAVAAGHFVVFT